MLSRRTLVLLTTAAVACLGAGAPGALAATRVPCPYHPGEVARSQGAVLWVQDGQLYGCAPQVRSRVAGYSTPQRSKMALGPWISTSKVSLRGISAVWSDATLSATGVPNADRLWAYDLRRGKLWMRGVSTTPPVTTTTQAGDVQPGDNTVVAVRAESGIAAWVTTGGAVVVRARSSEQELNDLGIGAGLIEPEGAGLAGDGLVPESQLVETYRRVQVGRWVGQADAVGRSLRIGVSETVGDGDPGGTSCSVSVVWAITVRPFAKLPRVGATWSADDNRRPSDCIRPGLGS